MNRITLCLAYYENPCMLHRQLADLAALPLDLQSSIEMIVVDDGSSTWPALDAIRMLCESEKPQLVEMRLYRMLEDIPWNMDACRNLAVSEAATPWVLLTDIDHRIPEKTWRKIITGGFKEDAAYKFGRVSEPDMAPYKQHPNTWLMTRELFDKAGGYDERFRGWYGTDGDFRNSVKAVARVLDLKEHVIRVPREVTPDASTTTLTRRSPENSAALDRVKIEREKIKGWRPLRNLTPWERLI